MLLLKVVIRDGCLLINRVKPATTAASVLSHLITTLIVLLLEAHTITSHR